MKRMRNIGNNTPNREIGSVVEHVLPKHRTRVRFPHLAPKIAKVKSKSEKEDLKSHYYF